MDDLYYDDFYRWSQQQAAILRTLSDRRDLPNELDLARVIEEIEGVGGSELNSVRSFLGQLFVHLIKAASSSREELITGWLDETLTFRSGALKRYTRSMAQNIDLDEIWEDALREAKASLALYDERMRDGLPATCPLDLDILTAKTFDPEGALAIVSASARGGPPTS